MVASRQLRSLFLSGGLVLTPTPLLAQPEFSEQNFCRAITRVIAAVEQEKLGPFKGAKLDKVIWQARESLPGMDECKIEDPGPQKHLTDLLLAEIGFRCRARYEYPRTVLDPDAAPAKVEEARQQDEARARELADRNFAALEQATAACLKGLPVERSVGEGRFDRGMPKVVFRKRKSFEISLRMTRTLPLVHYIGFNVVLGF